MKFNFEEFKKRPFFKSVKCFQTKLMKKNSQVYTKFHKNINNGVLIINYFAIPAIQNFG